MNPIIQHVWTREERARYGIRGIEEFTTEELALLHAKVVGWVGQRDPHLVTRRHRAPFVMNRRTVTPD